MILKWMFMIRACPVFSGVNPVEVKHEYNINILGSSNPPPLEGKGEAPMVLLF